MSYDSDDEIVGCDIRITREQLVILNHKLTKNEKQLDIQNSSINSKIEDLLYSIDEFNYMTYKNVIREIDEFLAEINGRLIIIETKLDMRDVLGKQKGKFINILTNYVSNAEVVEYYSNTNNNAAEYTIYDSIKEYDKMKCTLKKINESIAEFFGRLHNINKICNKTVKRVTFKFNLLS
ncbi:MAG: hypothetical protein Satyrvirus4_2 [Satyrvirus sp.]|uniref:Uncharacterized protein n=1 Tax=Satyrvirus sp. TaxID=2487771 RepID=A0A3G5AD07_9VIRU|nr:MAG: hypothetical protein Satyrvirus4_2 [Satyrvirus sp.]